MQEIQREFDYQLEDFQFVQKKIFKLAGISLSDSKQQMVYSRLARRLRTLGLTQFSEYCRLLKDNNSQEIDLFINALTTNKTSFFRENHHFEYLIQTIVPDLMRKHASTKKIRIWSSACSTGEEPYSIAMALNRTSIFKNSWDTKILATDLDSNVLLTAKNGVYDEKLLDDMDDKYKRISFLKGEGEKSDKVKIVESLASRITFKQLNLMGDWPISGPLDVIFCRNVIIYFDKVTQQQLFKRFYDLLSDDGYLIIGHSENLGAMTESFKVLGRTIYRKF